MARIAVIGAGLIGARHAELVARSGQLAAVVDPSTAARHLAKRLECPHFPDTETLLNTAHIDAAIVATPNALHAPVATALISAGIPALIEKPICDDLGQAKALSQLALEKSVPLLIGHHRRHNPIITKAKSVIDSGALGQIAVVDAKFWLRKPESYFDQSWRRKSGAGPVFINLIHDIDLLRHLCGEVISVQAATSNGLRGFEVEDTAAVLLQFENGALGTVTASDAIPAPWSWEFTAAENPAYPHVPGSAYKIGGTKASLSIPDLKLWYHPDEQSWWSPIDVTPLEVSKKDALSLQLSHFGEVIVGAAAPLVSAQSATRSLAVIDAIGRAARDGKAVTLTLETLDGSS